VYETSFVTLISLSFLGMKGEVLSIGTLDGTMDGWGYRVDCDELR